MMDTRLITLTVRYEPHAQYGHSLAWVAPELAPAGLALTEDHLDGQAPFRTWAGSVDGSTFARLAEVWRLPHEEQEPGRCDDARVSYTKTLDGMNWEIDQQSPIISASLRVTRPDLADGTGRGRWISSHGRVARRQEDRKVSYRRGRTDVSVRRITDQ
jgi:hypothetical protein